MPSGVKIFFVLGVVLGGAAGAVSGAEIASWTGGLIGAYSGTIFGMCVIGGLAGVIWRGVDQEDRGEAILMLVFGVFATGGALTGYWLGTLGIPRFPSLLGFFLGFVVFGCTAGVVASKVLDDRANPAILLLLLCGPAAAGFGAWLGIAVGSPVLVAIGLVIGSVVGTSMANSMNMAIAQIGRGPHERVHRRPW